jgi:hypothetical protein
MHIDQHQMDRLGPNNIEGLTTVTCQKQTESPTSEGFGQRIPKIAIVVGDQQLRQPIDRRACEGHRNGS